MRNLGNKRRIKGPRFGSDRRSCARGLTEDQVDAFFAAVSSARNRRMPLVKAAARFPNTPEKMSIEVDYSDMDTEIEFAK